MDQKKLEVSVITVDEAYRSVFRRHNLSLEIRGGMTLTNRIDALNFRLRESTPGYCSSWHVAGDPTMIAVQQGCLRIRLRNGDYHDFEAGDVFIAMDYLPAEVNFDDAVHGHMAETRGDQLFKAVHIKLDQKTFS